MIIFTHWVAHLHIYLGFVFTNFGFANCFELCTMYSKQTIRRWDMGEKHFYPNLLRYSLIYLNFVSRQ